MAKKSIMANTQTPPPLQAEIILGYFMDGTPILLSKIVELVNYPTVPTVQPLEGE
jgi:hypothetical protein